MAVLYTNLLIYYCVLSFVNYALADGPYLYFLPFELKPLTSSNPEFSVPGLQPVNEIKNTVHKPPLQPVHHHHKAAHAPLGGVPHTKIIDHQETEKVHADNTSISIIQLLHALGLDESIRNKTAHTKLDDEDQPADHAGQERSSDYSPPPLYGPLEAPELKAFLPDRLDLVHPVMTKLFSGLFSGGVVKDVDLGLKGALIQKVFMSLLLIKDVLKPLIAKLGVPLIALILINLEVLVIMWWIWGDCPRQYPVSVPHSLPVPYHPPPLYSTAPYYPAPPFHSVPPTFHEPSHYGPAPYSEPASYHYAPEPHYPDPYYPRPEPHISPNPYY